MAQGTVVAKLNYLKRLPLYQTEKPFQLFLPVDQNASDRRQSNLEFEGQETVIVDIRPRLTKFTLDEHGFQILRAPTSLSPASFQNRQVVESQYFNEVVEILKRIPDGYDQIFLFDWRLRNTGEFGSEDKVIDLNDLTTWLKPATTVHIDQSPWAVLHRVKLHLPDDAPLLLQGRVRVINVWRPIDTEVEDYPLAFCDGSTVRHEDLVECDHVRRGYTGETLYSYYNNSQQWYYLGQQTREEVALLKVFDSDSSAKVSSKGVQLLITFLNTAPES